MESSGLIEAKEEKRLEIAREGGGIKGDFIWVEEALQEAEDLSKKEGGRVIRGELNKAACFMAAKEFERGARKAGRLTTTEAGRGSEEKTRVEGLGREGEDGGEGGGVEEERVWTGSKGGGKRGRAGEEKVKAKGGLRSEGGGG